MANLNALIADHKARKRPHGTVMAVSMMKDEAPFLLEWFAHHLAVGFTDILVYTNDCSDGTDEMLQRLEALGLGFHRPNVIPEGGKPQPSALKHAQAEPLVRAADWVFVFDADEFLSINHPSHTIEGMLDDVVARGGTGIVVTWRTFGSGGVIDWSRAPVTEQYTRAAPREWNKGWGVKTLFKFDNEYWKLGIHRPSIKNKHLETDFPDTVHWLNGSGAPMEDYFKFRGWRSIRRTVGFDWVQLNHYAVKSVDSYAIRKFRGNVNNKKDKYNADYWSLQDRNEIKDTRIAVHFHKRRAIMEALLEDPVLAKFHEAALERVEARLEEYKQTEAYQTLRDGLVEAGKVHITQVEAKPPKARDPAKIAALMEDVRRKQDGEPEKSDSEDRSPRETREVSGWKTDDGNYYLPIHGATEISDTAEWVTNHDILLPADGQIFLPAAIDGVVTGRFDRRNARNIESYVDSGTRVLDIGTGVGFIPMKLAKTRPEIVLMAQDSRTSLIKAARAIAAKNDLDNTAQIKFVDGPLSIREDAQDSVGLMAYLNDFKPDVLRIGSVGQVSPALIASTSYGTVKRLIIPFANFDHMRALREAFDTHLTAKGFSCFEDATASGSLLYLRDPE